MLVQADCPWSEEWVLRAAEQVRRKRSPKKTVRVVFVGDTQAAWAWAQLGEATREALAGAEVVLDSLEPWADEALRRWLEDADFGPRDRTGRDRIGRATGGWGEMLHAFAERCKDSAHGWEDILVAFDREPAGRPDSRERLGVVAPARPVLGVMAHLGEPVSAELLDGFLDDAGRAALPTVLRWAELVSFVRRVGRDQWELNPLVQRAVQSAG